MKYVFFDALPRIYTLADDLVKYLCYRRGDILTSQPPLSLDDVAAFPPSLSREDALPGEVFIPHMRIQPPDRCQCSKARYPYLVLASPEAAEIYVYNLKERKLEQTIDASAHFFEDRQPAVRLYRIRLVGPLCSCHTSPLKLYIELDERFVFIAGSKFISIFDRHSRRRIATTPDAESNLLEDLDHEWRALHHDVRGGHLLAGSDSGMLFWTSRYSDALKGSVRGAVLVMDRGVTQLSVENGRAVFVTYCVRFDIPC
jgi:hypothetical protein